MAYNPNIPHLEVGYNPFINHLLTSWDIQVPLFGQILLRPKRGFPVGNPSITHHGSMAPWDWNIYPTFALNVWMDRMGIRESPTKMPGKFSFCSQPCRKKIWLNHLPTTFTWIILVGKWLTTMVIVVVP